MGLVLSTRSSVLFFKTTLSAHLELRRSIPSTKAVVHFIKRWICLGDAKGVDDK